MYIKAVNKKKRERTKVESYKNDYLAKLKTFKGDTSALVEDIKKEQYPYKKIL